MTDKEVAGSHLAPHKKRKSKTKQNRSTQQTKRVFHTTWEMASQCTLWAAFNSFYAILSKHEKLHTVR